MVNPYRHDWFLPLARAPLTVNSTKVRGLLVRPETYQETTPNASTLQSRHTTEASIPHNICCNLFEVPHAIATKGNLDPQASGQISEALNADMVHCVELGFRV